MVSFLQLLEEQTAEEALSKPLIKYIVLTIPNFQITSSSLRHS